MLNGEAEKPLAGLAEYNERMSSLGFARGKILLRSESWKMTVTYSQRQFSSEIQLRALTALTTGGG